MNPDAFGRLHSSIGTVFGLTFYVYNQNAAIAIGETNNNPFYGIFQPQTGAPFSVASLGKPGTLIEGTSGPTLNGDRDISGVITLDGTSVVGGTQDESTTAGNTSAENVTGTYLLTATGAANGSGTIALTAPSAAAAAFFIVSPTQAVLVTTTSGDTEPVVIILGH